MKRLALVSGVVGLLAGCGADLSDPRTQALLQLPSQQHYAERQMAIELSARCNRYSYDQKLADAMSEARRNAGQPNAIQVREGSALEAGVKRRTLSARYGADRGALDACATLDAETSLGSPFTVLAKPTG
ncbi:MAG: hypothetical protein AB3N13_10810 [Arenibacterium sp.]